ncbi:uncharacterized protein LOC142534545 isoform X2 [Primulina tabacum]|uniref:uncharacterized protein LOC142534545 isoform X2 n=1 Tax=Primulina tabacum TaxID=48773 RepID=UPI003F5946F5
MSLQDYFSAETNIHADTGISEEALRVLMRLLKKYLMDDSVEIIDMESQALRLLKRPIQVSCHWQKEQHRGFLSTENGQRALMQLHSFERSLIEVHENIFIESNASIKSIQLFLHALNELRLCHVTGRKSSVVPQKQESSKVEVLDNLHLCFEY